LAATTEQDNALEVERVDSLERLSELKEEWALARQSCPHKHVLMDHRWLCTWLPIFGDDKQPCILVLREQGTIAGIVPLMLSRGYELFPTRKHQVHMAEEFRYTRVPRAARLLPIRRLTFCLSGALANRRSHFLFDEQDPRLYETTLSYLDRMADEWDLMVIEGLPEGSGQQELLLQALQRSRLTTDGRLFVRETLYADLPASMDLYLASKRRHFRRRLVEQCRQAERSLPGLQVREYRGARIDEGMDRLLALERLSWKAHDIRDRKFYIGPEPELQAFHRASARVFAETDEAVVISMEVGERTAAAILCLESEGVSAAIITFMDATLPGRWNTAPMFRRLLESCMERGLCELDFNGNTRNVAKWADSTRRSSRYFLYNGRPYSRFLHGLSVAVRRMNDVVSRFSNARSAASGEAG
jgi:hypothetical protein